MTIKALLVGASAGFLLTACASAERQYDNMSDGARGATVGALGGAAAGAIIAGEGDDLEGALIGAGIGAAGGYIIGNEADKRRDRRYQDSRGYSQGVPAGIATDANRYYDERTQRYYYRDPATGATYYANGERRT